MIYQSIWGNINQVWLTKKAEQKRDISFADMKRNEAAYALKTGSSVTANGAVQYQKVFS
jgi:hypothetical protein